MILVPCTVICTWTGPNADETAGPAYVRLGRVVVVTMTRVVVVVEGGAATVVLTCGRDVVGGVDVPRMMVVVVAGAAVVVVVSGSAVVVVAGSSSGGGGGGSASVISVVICATTADLRVGAACALKLSTEYSNTMVEMTEKMARFMFSRRTTRSGSARSTDRDDGVIVWRSA